MLIVQRANVIRNGEFELLLYSSKTFTLHSDVEVHAKCFPVARTAVRETQNVGAGLQLVCFVPLRQCFQAFPNTSLVCAVTCTKVVRLETSFSWVAPM